MQVSLRRINSLHYSDSDVRTLEMKLLITGLRVITFEQVIGGPSSQLAYYWEINQMHTTQHGADILLVSGIASFAEVIQVIAASSVLMPCMLRLAE